MTGPFASHPGRHQTAHQKRPSFFRRMIAAVRRKAAPAGVAAGAATALIADRFPCCACCCEDGGRCDPPDMHLAPCEGGCNEMPGGIVPAEGVLGDDMIADVRKQWNAWHDDTPVPTFTPRAVTKPSGFPALSPAQQAAHADAMYGLAARYLPAPPRPVNGRSLGTQPRVYGEAPQLEVERDMAHTAGLRARQRYEPASHELLEQILAGLEKL